MRRTPSIAGRLCGLLLVLSWLLTPFFLAPAQAASHHAPAPARLGMASMEEAPPASGIPTPSFDPAEQRRRHLARLGVDRWQAGGYRGQGLKVVILDSGFRGYRAQLGLALPGHVRVRSFRGDGNLEAKSSQHGILCGEVIHALAPDAELFLANWEPDRPDQFLAAVHWAREQGARILSCSLIMPSWSDGEGGGPIHAELARLLGSGAESGDMLFFASAGNTAQRHWSGPFHAGRDGWHEWQPGQVDNELWPWGDQEVSVELCWQRGAGYDLYIFDGTSETPLTLPSPPAAGGEGRVRGSVSRGQAQRCCAVLRFRPQEHHSYRVRIRHVQGPAGRFHLVSLFANLQHTTASGSIPFPADGPEVIAVGAVNGEGHRTPYSSCGPNSAQPKPDLVAPVPFGSLLRPQPFSGTSSAAPQAAALAALWWSRYPTWTAAQVRNALRHSARDLGPPGHDYATGYGVISLP